MRIRSVYTYVLIFGLYFSLSNPGFAYCVHSSVVNVAEDMATQWGFYSPQENAKTALLGVTNLNDIGLKENIEITSNISF